MTAYVFLPMFDRVKQAGWSANPAGPNFWERVDDGPGWNNESVDHVLAPTNAGSLFEVAFQDVTDVTDALSMFGEPRVFAARIIIRHSLRENGARMEACLAIFGSFGSGIPATPVDSSIIYVPGSSSVQTLEGPAFLEKIDAYRGVYSLHKNDGTDWTAADLNSAVAQIKGWGYQRLYEVWMDVDIRMRPAALPGEPHYPNQKIGQFQQISWRYYNYGDGAQKKYQVRVFTAAQYAAGGAGVNTWTKACTLDSTEVESSKNYHDFGSKVGNKFVQGIPNGTWTVAIRVAKDWKGSDWWSPDQVQTMIIANPGSTTITLPVTNDDDILTVSRPAFSATTTIGVGDTRQSQWVLYQKPTAGFPDRHDPENTDLEPYWQDFLSGPATTIYPDLEHSLKNGSYRIYARHQETDFNDWTPWVYKNFVVNVASQPPPSLTITADPTNARVKYVLDWMYSTNLWDMRAVYLRRDSEDNDPTLVRLAGPDIYNGLVPDSTYFPGTAGNYIRHSSHSAHHPTNGLDIAVECRPPDWASHGTVALASRWNATGDQRSWLFLLRSDNKLELRWSTSGTSGTTITQTSTVALPAFTNPQFRWLRAKITITSPYNLTFQYSQDAVTWTTLGSVIVGAGATSFFNNGSTTYLEWGSSDNGTLNLAPLFFRQSRSRATVDGTVDDLAFKAYGYIGVIGSGDIPYMGANTVWHFREESYDQEIPFNKNTTYTAYYKTLNETLNEYAWSNEVTSGVVNISKQETWLRVLDDPSLTRRVLAAQSWQEIQSGNVRSTSRALGRTMPIVQKGVGRGDTFSFGFTVIGEDANYNLINALNSGSKLLLTTPKRQWYVEVIGPYQTRSRIYDSRYGDEDTRIIEVPFIEVSPY